jgi:hypothetical protein
MKKNISLKQVEANRENCRKSTGPRTVTGRKASRMNALKHGILSEEVVVKGLHAAEDQGEFKKLHERFCEELQPLGAVEEMLVDQIVTSHWRLRRALTAESGEIALSVDGGQWHRETVIPRRTALRWDTEEDPAEVMSNSATGNAIMANQVRRVLASVEANGELTQEAIAEVRFHGRPYGLTHELIRLRSNLQKNPEGLSPEALRDWQKQQAVNFLKDELSLRIELRSECEQREMAEEEARQAAAVLPSAETLEKIQRYEAKLERQMFRAMAHLERLQRMRRGETVPAPVSVAVS